MAVKKSSRNKFIAAAVITFLTAAILFITFNQYGLLKLLSLKKEINTLKEEIKTVEETNKNLASEIDSLQRKEPHKIEKTAREKYKMRKQSETIYEIEEE